MVIPRKPRTTRYVRSGNKGIRSAYPTKVSTGRLPLRTRVGVRNVRKNKKISRMMNTYAETKLSALTQLNEANPVPIQPGSLPYKATYVLGTTQPSGWTGFNPLGGFAFPQGTGVTDRVGNYMYLKNTTINMRVDMNAVNLHAYPTQFRVIVFRQRRGSSPAGISYNPDTALFLNESGGRFGSGVIGTLGYDLMTQPTNKRDFIIVCDKKFILQNQLAEVSEATARGGVFYPTSKSFRFSLKHNKKANFIEAGSQEPTDFDYHYGIAVYASRIGQDDAATDWELNLRGTTSANDI